MGLNTYRKFIRYPSGHNVFHLNAYCIKKSKKSNDKGECKKALFFFNITRMEDFLFP